MSEAETEQETQEPDVTTDGLVARLKRLVTRG